MAGDRMVTRVVSTRYWLVRAEKLRLLAESVREPSARQEMLRLAAAYRCLAGGSEEQLPASKPGGPHPPQR
jgi:hypothetical protein